MATTGWIFDPDTGGRHNVRIEVRGAQFVIEAERLPPRTINPETLYPVERQRGAEVYAMTGVAGWRLGLTQIDDPLVEARLPEFTLDEAAAARRGPLLWMILAFLVMGAVLYYWTTEIF
ncbi:MAG: hypothetical protein WA979_00215 [Pacificimonas sp.]